MEIDEFVEELRAHGTASVDLKDPDSPLIPDLAAAVQASDLACEASKDGSVLTLRVVGERTGREGDSQPIPTREERSVCVQDAVVALINERRELGVRRYGSPLMTHNGRDSLVDLRDELLDALMYVTQAILERDAE